MIVSTGIINAVINYVASVFKGACGLIGGSIGKAGALLRRIDKVVGISDLSGRAGFEEQRLLFCTIEKS